MNTTRCPLCNSNQIEQAIYYEKYPLYIKPVNADQRNKVPLAPLSIIVCSKCSFVYQQVLFNPNEFSNMYEINYESYHSPVISGIGSGLAKDFLEFLEKHMQLDKKNVLEIGCYDGYFLSLLRDKHSCAVKGCDPGPGKKIAEKIGVDVIKEYFSPSLFKEKFDLVVLRGVLEHIVNPIEFLKNIREVLPEKGTVVIEVPNVEYSLKNKVIGDFYHEHVSYFSKDTLINCLSTCGFKTVAIDNSRYYVMGVFEKSNNYIDETTFDSGNAHKIKQLFREYTRNIETLEKEIMKKCALLKGKNIYLWGGGGHTIGLLSKTYGQLTPIGIIDGDTSKEGKYVAGFNILIYSKKVLETMNNEENAIIISSMIFQGEIEAELAPYIKKGLTAIKLYPTVEYIKINQ